MVADDAHRLLFIGRFDLEKQKAPGWPVPFKSHLLWMESILLGLSSVFLGSSLTVPWARL
jgi:hypothetical protein